MNEEKAKKKNIFKICHLCFPSEWAMKELDKRTFLGRGGWGDWASFAADLDSKNKQQTDAAQA